MNETRTFLADVPLAPPPDGTARSRIQIAKTGHFKDPRWGAFAITRADFAEWIENYHKVTGDLLVDADHGSERPGGSSAARGWIKGLEAVGDQLFATVEWTRLGAEAIRDRVYRFISPTFGPYRDEQGNTHKNVLSSIALSNRPFLKGMAPISLSQHPITHTYTSKEDDSPMTDAPRTMDTDRAFEEAFTFALSQGLNEQHREGFRRAWTDNHAAWETRPEMRKGLIDTGRLYAEHSKELQAPAAAPVPAKREQLDGTPPNLDKEGLAFHRQVEARALDRETDYFGGFAAVTGRKEHTRLSDHPAKGFAKGLGLDEEQIGREARTRDTAKRLAIGFVDASSVIAAEDDVSEQLEVDGASNVPWLDSRPLSSPPKPWSEDDWERDKRRADAAGVFMAREEWQVAADAGEDLAGERAVEAREGDLNRRRGIRDDLVASGRESELERRREAIEDELKQRAEERLKGAGRPR